MKVWLGHYKGNPQAWFVCWGRTKDEAINFVDCEDAEPDFDSVQPLEGAGMIQFLAAPGVPEDEEDIPLAELRFLPESERSGIDTPRLGTDDWERISVTILEPPEPDGLQEVSHVANRMGISDPRTLATYAPRCEKCRKRHFGACPSPAATR